MDQYGYSPAGRQTGTDANYRVGMDPKSASIKR